MWIIPLLLLSAIAFAAASKSSREVVQQAPQFQIPPPVPPGRQQLQLMPSGLPGPIAALGESLRVGQFPPRAVIFGAIAEAEALGRVDLASDIARVFFSPPPAYERGSCGRSRGTPVDYSRGGPVMVSRPDYQRGRICSPPPVQREIPGPVEVVPQKVTRLATEEEILATLHTDPNSFLAMITSGRPPVIDVPVEITESIKGALPMDPVPGSPLAGVSDDTWLDFVSRLSREDPTFDSSRHIGQYRQRRDRLTELGIDPVSICGSSSAQRAALDADLMDAHGHAAAGGLLEYLDRPVVVPGREHPEKITLSGVLGVIQCAGLEGAAGWLERASDRKRYPHTTQTFLTTNGVF